MNNAEYEFRGGAFAPEPNRIKSLDCVGNVCRACSHAILANEAMGAFSQVLGCDLRTGCPDFKRRREPQDMLLASSTKAPEA